MGGKKLLLDDDAGEEQVLRVNDAYAKRFEHNKQREELHRLQAKHPELARRIEAKAIKRETEGGNEDDEDESSSEEEDDGFIPDETEAKIFETLLKIRSKDPSIYNSEVKFFNDEEEEQPGSPGQANTGTGGKHKPQYLKDVLAKQALEHGPEVSSSDDDGDEGEVKRENPKQLYDDEQAQLRQAFLAAVEDGGDDVKGGEFGGILKKRTTGSTALDDDDEGEAEGAQAGAQPEKKTKKNKKKMQNLVDAYFGSAEDQADAFLRDFILNKGWVEKSDMEAIPTYNEVVDDDVDQEDEAYLEQADKFEAAYNFRYEEPGGAAIVSHPREVEGTVRRVDDRRRKAREARKQRQDEAQAALQEEVKRLKNLKKKEIQDRLAKIARVAGAPVAGVSGGDADDELDALGQAGRKGPAAKGVKGGNKGGALRLDAALLDGDFDPEEWDKQMAAAFDDDYYEGEEEDLDDLLGDDARHEMEALIGKLSDDDDDDEQLSGEGGDVESEGTEEGEEGAGKAVTFKTLRKKLVGGGESEEGVGGLDDDDEVGRAKAAAAATARAELNKLLEEYHKLDHEGVAGGIKTRFKYRQVPAETFGLTVQDILNYSDKELNQVVGLKRLAPYREDQGKARPNYKALEEMKKSRPDDHRNKRKQFGGWNGSKNQTWGGQDKPDRSDKSEWQQHKKHKQGEEGQTGEDKQAAHKDADTKQQSGKPQQQQQSGKPQHQQQTGKPQQQQQTGKPQHQQQSGKPQHQQQSGKSKDKHKRQLDPEAARKASYAPLAVPGTKAAQGGQDRKRKQQDGGGDVPQGKKHKPQPAPVTGPNGEQLTKAQRKNLKRTLKRKAAKGETGGEGQSGAGASS